MTTVTNAVTVTPAEVLGEIAPYATNPLGLVRKHMELLERITDGDVSLVDATNPLVWLLTTSCVNTAMIAQEMSVESKGAYPIMAQEMTDLFRHMSAKDHTSRFASPTLTKFKAAIQLNELQQEMVYEESSKAHRVTIPRDTVFTVDGIDFMPLYPIDVRYYDTGLLQISYDAAVDNPIRVLSESIIDYDIRRGSDTVDWVVFEIDVVQVSLASTQQSVTGDVYMKKEYTFSDWFHYARVFHTPSSNPLSWVEMKTTFSDQVFDPLVPTAVLAVTEIDGTTGTIEVGIPLTYTKSGLVSGMVRVDIYTTKGVMTLNLGAYEEVSAFGFKLQSIDAYRDATTYTNAMGSLSSFRVFSSEIVTGGSAGVTFSELRELVINGGNDYEKTPITNIEVGPAAAKLGFTITTDVDVLTNRVFQATRRLPKPIDTKLITPAYIGVSTLYTTIDDLDGWEHVYVNGSRTTIAPRHVYTNTNGVVEMVTDAKMAYIKQLTPADRVDYLNTLSILYTPFYYVLDSGESEFEVRAYHLDDPEIKSLSFDDANATLQLAVESSAYEIITTPTGYRLRISCKSGEWYKALMDSEVGVQLRVNTGNGTEHAFIEGVLEGLTTTGERIWYFDIQTTYDIDSDDQIEISNTRLSKDNYNPVMAKLLGSWNILHYTTSVVSGYVTSAEDALLATWVRPDPIYCAAKETMVVSLGVRMSRLWTRCRQHVSGNSYETYSADVPLVATKDEFDFSGNNLPFEMVNGVRTYKYLHRAGDVMKNAQGETIFAHRAGDIKMDNSGNPIPLADATLVKEFDILMVDGKYFFADDSAFVDYRDEVAGILANWSTTTLDALSDRLLEKTKVYFYPETTLSVVKARADGVDEINIQAQQSLSLALMVNRRVRESEALQESIRATAVRIIDAQLANPTINILTIIDALKTGLGSTVESFSLTGLGGDANYSLIKISDGQSRLSLGKRLELQEDNTLIVVDDLTVTFLKSSESTD